MRVIERVGPIEDLPDGKTLRVEIGDRAVVIVRIGDDVYALGDRCSHQDIPLSEGEVLSEDLQIENNDVHCSHASAVGPIDEEQRFYLESRGVPTRVAERLIVAGFFAEVFDRLPANDLRPALDAAVAAKLSAVLA